MAQLTKAERRRINRANGAKGGPKTDEGKRRSRQNALKEGLCAKVLSLANEDAYTRHPELERWIDHCRPRNDHEAELVRRIGHACLLRQRCERAFQAAVTEQGRNAHDDLDRACEAEVEGFQAHYA